MVGVCAGVGLLFKALADPAYVASVDVLVAERTVDANVGSGIGVISLDTEAQRAKSVDVVEAVEILTGQYDVSHRMSVSAYPISNVLRLEASASTPLVAEDMVRTWGEAYPKSRKKYLERSAQEQAEALDARINNLQQLRDNSAAASAPGFDAKLERRIQAAQDLKREVAQGTLSSATVIRVQGSSPAPRNLAQGLASGAVLGVWAWVIVVSIAPPVDAGRRGRRRRGVHEAGGATS